MEPVYTFVDADGVEKPMAFRQDIIKQMSSYKKKFVYYRDYASKSVSDIFDAPLLENSTRLTFTEPRTIVLLNMSGGRFDVLPLPWQAQISPVYAIRAEDTDADGIPDLILGGNLFSVKPEMGRYDALHGAVLKGKGNGQFTYVPPAKTGVIVPGETRHIATLRSAKSKLFAFFRNNGSVVFYK